MRENRADELDRFKLEINLADFAQAKGYQPVKAESSRASVVMRHTDGDKIVVATDKNGHGIYFSVRDQSDNGSIVDFVQKRQGLNLGQVRKELRAWYPSSSYCPPAKPETAERLKKPEPSNRDRTQVLAAWIGMQPAGQHDYLLQRQLSPQTLTDPRFAGAIRRDRRGNAVFPHFDRDGLTGYELKNDSFTGFAKHGEKTLWHSANIKSSSRLVITESAIDALSHAQLKHDHQVAYVSVGGSMSDKQRDLLTLQIADAHQRGGAIIIGADNDQAGDQLADQIKKLAPAGAKVERQRPKFKDWNDDLRAPALWQQFCKQKLADAHRELQEIHSLREELRQLKKLKYELEERQQQREPGRDMIRSSIKYGYRDLIDSNAEYRGEPPPFRSAGDDRSKLATADVKLEARYGKEIEQKTDQKLRDWHRQQIAGAEQLAKVLARIEVASTATSGATEKHAEAKISAIEDIKNTQLADLPGEESSLEKIMQQMMITAEASAAASEKTRVQEEAKRNRASSTAAVATPRMSP